MKVEDMSPIDRLKSVKGEAYQGNYLVSAKERNSEKKYSRGQHSSSSRLNNARTGAGYYAASTSKVEMRHGMFWKIISLVKSVAYRINSNSKSPKYINKRTNK